MNFLKKIKRAIIFSFNEQAITTEEISKRQKNEVNLEKDLFVPISQFNDNDIFIIGFPKSGNTWMQTISSSLLFGIDTKYMSDKLAQEIVPDIHSRSYYKRFGTFNFFKSHDLPKPEYKKVIYIVRDGRDAITSYLHFKNKLGVKLTIRDFYTNQNAVFPTFWHKHVNAWLENPYNSEILYIKYEDLINRPKDVLKEIMKFTYLERSDELVDKIIEGSSIDNMRNRVLQTGGMGNINWAGKKGVEFFRKGVIGDYINHMTKDEIREFNMIANMELKKFNYIVD